MHIFYASCIFSLMLQAYLSLSREDVEQLRDVFRYFDSKDSGYITSKHLGITLRSLEPKPIDIDIEDMMRSVVDEYDNKITFQEFLNKVCEVIEIVRTRTQTKKHRSVSSWCLIYLHLWFHSLQVPNCLSF